MDLYHTLIVLMERLDFLVDLLNMKELLRYVVIVPGGQYLTLQFQILLHKPFVINWDTLYQVLYEFGSIEL